MKGRPLRFLAAVLGGWVAVRLVLLWPGAPMDGPPARLAQPRGAGSPSFEPLPVELADVRPFAPERRHMTSWPQPVALPAGPRSFAVVPAPMPDPDRVALAMLAMASIRAPQPAASQAAPALPPLAPFAGSPSAGGRLTGSFWLIARSGEGLGQGPLGNQLGGSQAGLRLAYALDRERRLALAARFASPLSGPGREAAIGLEWQPTRAPVRLVAEQRFAIDGGGGGPSLGVVGGIGPVALKGFRLEAYGQGGVIGRGRGVGFVDGAVRVERRVARAGSAELLVGGGAWGGAQPGAARLDLGPSVSLAFPVARQRLRLSLEWRERIAGNARPESGLALTLGGDLQ